MPRFEFEGEYQNAMIGFKGSRHPKSVILCSVFLCTIFRIVIWRRLWRNVGSKLTMQR
jgi:hypothetical protein